MIKKLLLFLLIAIPSGAQVQQIRTASALTTKSALPSGCNFTPNYTQVLVVSNTLYICGAGFTYVAVSGGAAAVTSVFGRTGAVVSAANDYDFTQLSGSIALAQTPLTTRGDLLVVNSSPALARLAKGAANTYPKWSSTDLVVSTLAAGGIGACTNQVVTVLNADAAPTCTTITSAYVDSSIVVPSGTLTAAKLLNGNGTNQAIVTNLGYVTPALTGPAAFSLTSADSTPLALTFGAAITTLSGAGNPAFRIQSTTAGTGQFPQLLFLDSTGATKVALTAQTNGNVFFDFAAGTLAFRNAIGSGQVGQMSATLSWGSSNQFTVTSIGTVATSSSVTAAGVVSSGANLITLGSTVVGSLPAVAGAIGKMIKVSDSTAVALEGQACVGGGSATALAFSDGTTWKCF